MQTLLSRASWLFAPVSGVLLGLAYAPIKFWPAAIIGMTLFIVMLRDQPKLRVLGLSYIAGLAMNTITLGWISVLGWYVAAALIAFMSLWMMLLGLLIAKLQLLPGWPVFTALAVVTIEFGASSVPFDGFGWNRLAYTSADQPLSGYLPIIGVSGVSFLIALIGALLVNILYKPKKIITLILIAVIFLLGAALKLIPEEKPHDEITIGIVQGNVDGIGHGNRGYAQSVTRNHLSETINLMAKVRTGLVKEPDFILWPENSTDIDPLLDDSTKQLINFSTAIADSPIFVGAVTFGPGPNERQTTGIWWDPKLGSGPRYDKRNLVPFGEWIPFREFLLPRLPILKQIGRQGVPGTKPGVIEVSLKNSKLLIGDIICFELAYDETVYDTIKYGAKILVVQSNNATYTATGQPHQQFEITRIRAMETKRELVVATTSSFSGLILPNGLVESRTEEAVAASNTVTVPLRNGTTLGVYLQPTLSMLASFITISAFLIIVLKKKQ